MLGRPTALGVRGADATGRHLLAGHEGQQADEDGAHFPGRVEGFGVEVGDGEAESRGGLETAGRRVHANGRRCEGVVGWEDEGSPVLAIVVGRLLGAGDYVVPPVG